MLGKVNVGGSSGGYALENETSFKLDPKKDGSGNVWIYISDPEDSTDTNAKWKSTTLVRNSAAVPKTIQDGDIIFVNKERDRYKEEPYVDDTCVAGEQYYYRAFPLSKQNIMSLVNSPYDDVFNATRFYIWGTDKGTEINYLTRIREKLLGEGGTNYDIVHLTTGESISTSRTTMQGSTSGSYEVSLNSSMKYLEFTSTYSYSRSTGNFTGATNRTFTIYLQNLDKVESPFTKLGVKAKFTTPTNLYANFKVECNGTTQNISGNVSETNYDGTMFFDLTSLSSTTTNIVFTFTNNIRKTSSGDYYGSGTCDLIIDALWLE